MRTFGTDRRTDRRTDGGGFIRTPEGVLIRSGKKFIKDLKFLVE